MNKINSPFKKPLSKKLSLSLNFYNGSKQILPVFKVYQTPTNVVFVVII